MDRKIIDEYLKILGYVDRPDFLDKYLNAPSLLRLKKIGYFCGMDYASKEIYDFSEKVSRYDHSLSCALITWMLTKDKCATLAALFHDISTPCFSHVIDYMNKDYVNQESTEEKTEEIIRNDGYLCDCLFADRIHVSDIVDFKKYSIVDLDRPMLCADRLDGIILTGLFWTKSIDISEVKDIINDLDVFKNEYGVMEIGVRSQKVFELLIKNNDIIDKYCHSNEDTYMMELLARITRKAIEMEIISYDDLFVLDEEETMIRFYNYGDMLMVYDLYSFGHISKDKIPMINIPKIKVRELKPMVNSKR